MKRIRVCHLIESGGGSAKQVVYLCNHLDPKRFEINLIFSRRTDSPDYEKCLKGHIRWYEIRMKRGISPILDLWALVQILSRLWKLKPDILHTHSSKAGFLGRLAGWLLGVPVRLYSPRGFAFLRQDVSWLTRAFYRLLERVAGGFGTGIVAVSSSEEGFAREVTRRGKIHVIENGIDLSEAPRILRTKKRKDKFVIASAGRLSSQRGPFLFLDIAEKLSAHRGASFLWIGDGELGDAFRREIARRNLADRFEVTGWVGRDELYRRLARADVFLNTSLWEGLPNVLLEAMALGLPVIATSIGGNRDVIPKEGGFLAEGTHEFSRILKILLRNPDLRNRVARRGREHVRKHFNLARQMDKMHALYESLAA